MARIRSFVRREPVLLIAALAALLSCIFVPPDAGYLDYPDLRTLALLYCLMVVVAGLRQAGLFSHLAHLLCRKGRQPAGHGAAAGAAVLFLLHAHHKRRGAADLRALRGGGAGAWPGRKRP